MRPEVVLWFCRQGLAQVFRSDQRLEPFAIIPVQNPGEFAERLTTLQHGAVVVELPAMETSPSEILRLVRRQNAAMPVILYDPDGLPTDAIVLEDEGAFAVLFGERSARDMPKVLDAALRQTDTFGLLDLASAVEQPPWRRCLIGESPAMQLVYKVIELTAPRQSTVLITGETGTGKEVVAKAIHLASDRVRKPLVALNCAAIPQTLLEAELFGHAKGAFTGAVSSRVGRFEQAQGGTIFLDEIGDLPLETQGKLLRVLQERTFERVGGVETVRADVRVIAATNVNLADAVSRKAFREDLYYRLKVVPLKLPPLRQRTGDVPLLVRHFVETICRKEGMQPKRVSAPAMDLLATQLWPGNVRQLEHELETAIVLSGDRLVLEPGDFNVGEAEHHILDPLPGISKEGLDFDSMMSEIQRYLLTQALEKAGGNKSRAAQLLHMKRSTLVSKVKGLV